MNELERFQARKRGELNGLLEARKDIERDLNAARAAQDPARIATAQAQLDHLNGRIKSTAEGIVYMKNLEV